MIQEARRMEQKDVAAKGVIMTAARQVKCNPLMIMATRRPTPIALHTTITVQYSSM